ncbi:peptidoglycan D,D-transpeptidase FtsI family protein [Paenibacillus wynnii]|uniref:peptidoglycan D,D-transpeptidase FtsI family protein n=1 Tax=Paenibacillus wynnii TaxID=268407 RepID=UPI00278D0F94|nr:penicillin-binding protein 2 [Paenibacillus wynnii]MDQ0191979.1 cell division protein FtsI/penicillin-binding protein 2 [Paenibacillus wynnii]
MLNKPNKRIFSGLIILCAAISILILRLAWVQFFLKDRHVPNSEYSLAKMAEVQSERETILDTGRGRLYDRNGKPLAGETIWTVAFFPQEENKGDNGNVKRDIALNRVAEILGTNYKALFNKISPLKEPILWPSAATGEPMAITPIQAEEISGLGIDGLKVLPFARRYNGDISGRQWMGYLSEAAPRSSAGLRIPMKGTAGLEKTLEPLLRGVGHTEAYAQVDARGNRLPGSDIKVRTPANPYYPLSLYTTIDMKIQEGIEELAVKAGVKEGAVVVLDAHTGDVVSMVSRPFYNPEKISPEGGEWNNRALKAMEPGSIFKIITAAAAIETGVTSPGELFSCKGEFDRYGLSCRQGKGHGPLTLEEGFAVSCNTVFATLAERLSGNQLQSIAMALGMGREITWQADDTLGMNHLKPLAGEQKGTIFNTLVTDDAGTRVQTAIGQRDVRVSPLQAANLIVTLLHGGEVTAPRILQRINFANGQKLMDLSRHLAPTPFGRISKNTAELLLSWMRKVVTEGTGSSLQSAKWPLAGKSGTAQTLVKGLPRNNQWFIGYGPFDRPQYTVAVVVQNVAPGNRHTATKLFGQVMDLLSETSPV